MLTRLWINGFKNILEGNVYFGPFTCIAGANGVGKSNLFDAIAFLRLLASQPLYDAALSIRDEVAKGGDVQSLFFHGPDHELQEMSFLAEMIVSKSALDDLRQEARATNTFLTYELSLRYRGEKSDLGPLEITKESLKYITKGDSPNHLHFPYKADPWRNSWLEAGRRVAGSAFISTEKNGDDTLIKVHQDKTGGRPQSRKASILPRTVLSSVNASEAPTAVAARQEMMNWRLLQFEPSALRASDPVRAPRIVAADGAHMPAALYGLLGNGDRPNHSSSARRTPDVRATIANRVSELVDDLRDVWVDEDSKREILTLHARLSDGTAHPARSLSDGTLRFLALAIIEQTPQSGGLYCLEEPENGIHPERIPAVLRLLRDIATDTDEEVDRFDNPLRQVIINTHSPGVVLQAPDDSLIVAEKVEALLGERVVSKLAFRALPETWRTKLAASGDRLMNECPKARLLSYLNPVEVRDEEEQQANMSKRKRVIDREDLKQLQLFHSEV
jgi:predicted ATPase